MSNEINVLPKGLSERDKIRHALRIRGITHKKVAERQGCTRIHVVRVLNGDRDSESLLNTAREMIREHDAKHDPNNQNAAV